jgi:hypothetical protein
VHWSSLKLPGPFDARLTFPVGALGVPPPVSVTVAVHDDGVPTAAVSGEQLTLVDVGRGGIAVTDAEAMLRMLPACLESPWYWMKSSFVPTALGVKPTEQLAVPGLAWLSVHSSLLRLPEPLISSNPTVPVGVLTVPGEVSVTVAVQVVSRPVATGFGEQSPIARAERSSTDSAWLPPLSVWVASPP